MSYLGVLEGVRFRLEGGSRTTTPSLATLTGPKVQQQHPSRDVGLQEWATVDAALRRQTDMAVGRIRVPIFWRDGGGQHFKALYPSLTFDIISTQPRFNEFVYQSKQYRGDMYQNDVETSKSDVYEGDELLGNYARMTRKRFVEHPLDVLIEIRAHSKDPIFMALLEEYVYGQFEPRDFLRVPMRDGSSRSWDVLFVSSDELDKRGAVRAGTPGVEREYTKAWTYKVEGYFDNTDKTELVNLVQSRTIAVTAL